MNFIYIIKIMESFLNFLIETDILFFKDYYNNYLYESLDVHDDENVYYVVYIFINKYCFLNNNSKYRLFNYIFELSYDKLLFCNHYLNQYISNYIDLNDIELHYIINETFFIDESQDFTILSLIYTIFNSLYLLIESTSSLKHKQRFLELIHILLN